MSKKETRLISIFNEVVDDDERICDCVTCTRPLHFSYHNLLVYNSYVTARIKSFFLKLLYLKLFFHLPKIKQSENQAVLTPWMKNYYQSEDIFLESRGRSSAKRTELDKFGNNLDK